MNKPIKKPKQLKRLFKMLFKFYPVMMTITIVFIIINAIVSAIPAVFMKNVIGIVNESYQTGDWNSVSEKILSLVLLLGIMYVISLIAGIVYNQLLAVITQGFLKKMRGEMFAHMQSLPIKYFDTHIMETL